MRGINVLEWALNALRLCRSKTEKCVFEKSRRRLKEAILGNSSKAKSVLNQTADQTSCGALEYLLPTISWSRT